MKWPQIASSSRLPRPWTSDGLSRYCPFAEFSGVAGVDAPAFVERSTAATTHKAAIDQCGVAGVDAPAFVERTSRMTCTPPAPRASRVAGVDAPAFVERGMLQGERARATTSQASEVSPGLTLRPSLSGEVRPRLRSAGAI